MQSLELERTFLARFIPNSLHGYPAIEQLDIYLPAQRHHPRLRLRRKGNSYEITKKTMVTPGDQSRMLEQTIHLDQGEFAALAQIPGKQVHKMRYRFLYQSYTAEIDVFLDSLRGLVLIDFEFRTMQEMQQFLPPNFCLTEVTQENFIAGGELCGKSYRDIAPFLARHNYQPLY